MLDQAQRQADDGKWSELPQGRDPRRPTEQEGGWVGPTAGLDAIQNTKFTVSFEKRITHPRSSSQYPGLYRD